MVILKSRTLAYEKSDLNRSIQIIMTLQRTVRGRLYRRNVKSRKQGIPNAPEVKPQGELTDVEFREETRMLSQVLTNQFGKQRGYRQVVVDTKSIFEFLRMTPPSFIGSITMNDPENFIEELKMVFYVMHVANTESVMLAAYQLKSIDRSWFD
ncbi:uncharacterized protein LOC114074402 [Solanum pennellii]|uniref:Uncharacterized protein LOC114074402 n=1 Tax=Solanum pennellii TaxID=28526 RepID=A0ABM1UXA3_SOLPN|nr:uncharacterized protein LOC114074402 [Solanum pennellii]